MPDELNVAIRDSRGSIKARRQRNQGEVPAVLYGHGKDNVCLSIPVSELEAVVRHGAHVVDLKGALDESALIKDIQWNAFGLVGVTIDDMAGPPVAEVGFRKCMGGVRSGPGVRPVKSIKRFADGRDDTPAAKRETSGQSINDRSALSDDGG